MDLKWWTENSESDNEPLANYANHSDNDESHDVNRNDSNVESVDENYTQNGPESKKKASIRKRWQSKKNDREYQRLFNENKHLFDMSCDCCSKIFESLDEGRAHYLTEHNNPKGYIKSISWKKRLFRCYVVEHLKRLSNPQKSKYVCESL